jgi:tetratricopeptide (TPR) repeat protein
MVDQSRLQSLLEEGDSKARVGDPESAISAYDEVLNLEPDSAEALERKAAALATIGDMDAALACHTQLVITNPRSAKRYLARARILSYLNRYTEAVEDLRRAIELGKDSDLSLLKELGLCLYRAGRFDEAISTYERAISLSSDDTDLQVALGDVLLDAGLIDKAIDAFTSANVGPKPRFTDVDWTTRGDRLLAVNRYTEAVTMYRTALSIKPNTAAWRGIAAANLTAKKYDDAITATGAALDLNPEDADTWTVRGCAYFESNKFPQALDCFDMVTSKEPDVSYGWSNRAVTLCRLERSQDALTAINHAIELTPNDASLWTILSECQLALGQNEAVVESTSRCLQLDETISVAMINRALALRSLRRSEEALRYCDRAIEIDSSEVAAWQSKALALADLNRADEAISTMDNAMSSVSQPQQALRAKGVMLSDQFGRHAEALEPLRRAWEMAPEDDFIASDYAEMLVKNCHFAEGRDLANIVAKKDTTPSRICAMQFIIFVSLILTDDYPSSGNAFNTFLNYYIENFVAIERRLSWTYAGLRMMIRSGSFPELSKFFVETLIDLQEGHIRTEDISYLKRRIDDAQACPGTAGE